MFALIALSSKSQISIQKSIYLPNLLRIEEQRKSIHIEIVLSLDKKLLVKGLGEQNELFRLSRTSRPSYLREKLANKNPMYRRATSLMGWDTMRPWPYPGASSSCISIRPGFLCIERRPLGWAERVTLKLIDNVRARQKKSLISLDFII